ncbi:MAG: metal-dependent hydrolase [Microthrixaceae bacterium]
MGVTPTATTVHPAPPLQVRTPRISFPDRIDTSWHPLFPEFAAAANSVSLLMPHVEPYVARATLAVRDQLDEELRHTATAFAAQELQHQALHRSLNQRMIAATPALARVERAAAASYGLLERRGDQRWSLAFAAASETVAFALARWTERHIRLLFDDADDAVATLFLWHLAEEVEHKNVAFDVLVAVAPSRRRYLLAGLVSLACLALFTIAGTVVQLWSSRRIWSPVAWWRLLRWSISLCFELLPDLFVGATRNHHPSQFSDPTLLVAWLRGFDPATGQDPLRRR